MTGILNNNLPPEPEERPYWPGTAYKQAPAIEPEVLARYTEKVRAELGIQTPAEKAREARLERLGEALEAASTTRPGYWW